MASYSIMQVSSTCHMQVSHTGWRAMLGGGPCWVAGHAGWRAMLGGGPCWVAGHVVHMLYGESCCILVLELVMLLSHVV